MKIQLFYALALAVALAGCKDSKNVEEVKKYHSPLDHYALAIQVGDDIRLPVKPIVRHRTNFNFVGTIMDHLYLTNSSFYDTSLGCQGCDSCMTCFADAGLVDYDVKSRTDDEVIASVHLTPKGEKYLMENCMDGFKEEKVDRFRNGEAKSFRKDGIELVCYAYKDFKEVNILKNVADKEFIAETVEQVVATPFGKVLGVEEGVHIGDTIGPNHYYYYYLDQRTKADTLLSHSEFTEKMKQAYDLDEYGSLENILRHHYNLLDSLWTVYTVWFSSYGGMKGGMSIPDSLVSYNRPLPDWFKESIVTTEGQGEDQEFVVRGRHCELVDLEDVHNWKPLPGERLDDDWSKWRMKEVYFTVKSYNSPLIRHCKGTVLPEEETYYTKCRFIEIGNKIWIPEQHCWWFPKKEDRDQTVYYPARNADDEIDDKFTFHTEKYSPLSTSFSAVWKLGIPADKK